MCYCFLLQGIFPSQGSNPHLQHLLHQQVDFFPVRVWVLLPQRSVLIRAVRNERWKVYSKSPINKPSRCQLSKIQTCIWFQQRTRTCVINIRCEWNCSLPSISYSWGFFSPTIFHLLSQLQPVTLLACVLDARPGILAVLLYKGLYYKIKKHYFLCLSFIYYLYEKYYKPITVQYYMADCVSWVTRLTLLDLKLALQMCSQKGTHSYIGDLLWLLFHSINLRI